MDTLKKRECIQWINRMWLVSTKLRYPSYGQIWTIMTTQWVWGFPNFQTIQIKILWDINWGFGLGLVLQQILENAVWTNGIEDSNQLNSGISPNTTCMFYAKFSSQKKQCAILSRLEIWRAGLAYYALSSACWLLNGRNLPSINQPMGKGQKNSHRQCV